MDYIKWIPSDKQPRVICVERELVASSVYLSLEGSACYTVYWIFRLKCRVRNLGNNINPRWVITNNGLIVFTSKEAEKKWGISDYKFRKAIKNLVEVGLLDIAKPGGGSRKKRTLYAISERWKLYGTDDFIKKEVIKRSTTGGFQKGNRYGRHFTPEEREQYRRELKEEKIQELQSKIDELERDKLAVLSEEKKRGRRRSRIPAVIDEVIRDLTYRLRKLQGT